MRSMSIQWKISLLAGSCLLLSTAAMTGVALYSASHSNQQVVAQSSQELKDNAAQLLAQQAETESTRIVSVLNDVLVRAQMVVQALQFQKQFAEDNLLGSDVLRGAVNQTVRSAAEHATLARGTYAVYLPDALDGEDANYVGSANLGANDKGRMAFYWSRNAKGELSQQTLDEKQLADRSLNANGQAKSDWWHCSQQEKTACLLDPYPDTRQPAVGLLTAVSMPLLDGDKLLGSIGFELPLAPVQAVLDKMDHSMFDGKGDVVLLSQNGIVAGSTRADLKAGQAYAGAGSDETAALLKAFAGDKRLIQWHIKSTTKAHQGLYEYDAVSRLRDAQQVMAFQRRRNRLLLDGGGGFIALFRQGNEERLGEAQAFEIGQSLSFTSVWRARFCCANRPDTPRGRNVRRSAALNPGSVRGR